LPGGTIITCISKPLNKGTSNSCICACMQIIQYALIEIVYKFYAQSNIKIHFTDLYNWIKLQVTVATYMKQVSFKNKLKWFRDKHKLHAVSSNMAHDRHQDKRR